MMLAILNFWGSEPTERRQNPCKIALSIARLAVFLTLLTPVGAAFAQDGSISTSASNYTVFARRAEQAFQTARTRFQDSTNDAEAEWQFGRACFDWAEFATSKAQRAQIAQQGIAACRALLIRDTNSAPGHYYLAMNLGELAETKGIGAFRLISEMEAEFKTASRLDPHLDYAGPDRSLGMLYHEAPGWPASIGSKAKARQHLLKAAELAPNYPDNLLTLIEAELDWGNHKAAQHELSQLEELWPAAQKQFAGPQWESLQAQWQARLNTIRKRLSGGSRKSTESPRDKE